MSKTAVNSAEVAPPPTREARVFPEIQALRFVAVGAVVLYHLWPMRITGGYVGVDVFFVISGFLITSHLAREIRDTGTLRFGRFYARRARRLLPASMLVLALVAVSTCLFLPQRLWEQVFSEIIGASLYVENWVLASASVDYLAQNTDIASPVQHYWSLSVEEQFYLVWPLVMLVAVLILPRVRRMSPRSVTGVLLGALGLIFAISLILSIVQTILDPGPAYFATSTRAWEFAAGGLLALVLRRRSGASALRAAGAWLGYAIIAATVLIYTPAVQFPGYLAALPVLGTVLVIASGDPTNRWAPGTLTRVRPVQYIGDISYSIYLVHWPLIVIVPYVLLHPLGTVDKVIILVVAVVLASLSKRFIEDPARRSPFLARSPRRTAIVAVAAVVPLIVFSVSMSAFASSSIAQKTAEARELIKTAGDCLGAGSLQTGCAASPVGAHVLIPAPDAALTDDVNTPDCWSRNGDDRLKVCSTGPVGGLRVALIGDSHSNQYLAAMQKIAADHGWRVDVYGKTGCVWTDAKQQNDPTWVANCESWKRKLDAHLAAVEPYAVIITSYQATSPFQVPAGADAEKIITDGFVGAWSPVAHRGTKIVAIRDNPRPRPDYLSCIQNNLSDPGTTCSVPQSGAYDYFDAQPAAVARVSGASLLDLNDLFCQAGRCDPVIGNVIVYRDATHLTSSYTRTMAPMIRDRILALTGLKDS